MRVYSAPSAQPAEFGPGSRGGKGLSWEKNSFRKPTKEQSGMVSFHHVSLEHGLDMDTWTVMPFLIRIKEQRKLWVQRVSHILFPSYAIRLGASQVLNCCVNHSSSILTRFSFLFHPWSNRVNLALNFVKSNFYKFILKPLLLIPWMVIL